MEFKTCSKCGVEKNLEEGFHKHSQCLGGYNTQCMECVCARSKAHYEAAKDNINSHRRAIGRTLEGKAKVILRTMRGTCKARGWPEPEFSLPDIIEAIQGVCAITGIPFELENRSQSKRNPFAASPDRRDNSIGYTKDNVQWVVWIYNNMKSDYPEEVIKYFLERLKNADSGN